MVTLYNEERRVKVVVIVKRSVFLGLVDSGVGSWSVGWRSEEVANSFTRESNTISHMNTDAYARDARFLLFVILFYVVYGSVLFLV